MKNKFLLIATIGLVIIFTGCSAGNESKTDEFSPRNANQETASGNSKKKVDINNAASSTSESANNCSEEKIVLPNYGDPAHRLKNCFVEYPGEPTRQDKHYYIIEDVCGQFTREFMENIIGQKLAKIEPPKISTLNNCSYYLDDKRYIMLNLEYLKIENQKTGNVAMGRKVEKSTNIPMENLVVYQEDGPINVIYFILGPEKFLSLRPSAADVFTNDQFIQIAAYLGNNIKDYR